jgi:hypothetical protein
LYFAPHALHILILPHVYAYTLDYEEPKSEIQAGQVQKKYGSPQAQSVRILTLLLNQGKSRCIQPIPLVFYFESWLYDIIGCALS